MSVVEHATELYGELFVRCEEHLCANRELIFSSQDFHQLLCAKSSKFSQAFWTDDVGFAWRPDVRVESITWPGALHAAQELERGGGIDPVSVTWLVAGAIRSLEDVRKDRSIHLRVEHVSEPSVDRARELCSSSGSHLSHRIIRFYLADDDVDEVVRVVMCHEPDPP